MPVWPTCARVMVAPVLGEKLLHPTAPHANVNHVAASARSRRRGCDAAHHGFVVVATRSLGNFTLLCDGDSKAQTKGRNRPLESLSRVKST